MLSEQHWNWRVVRKFQNELQKSEIITIHSDLSPFGGGWYYSWDGVALEDDITTWRMVYRRGEWHCGVEDSIAALGRAGRRTMAYRREDGIAS